MIPLMIVFIPIGHFNRKKFEKKYAEFLAGNNGGNFFCYNNRKNSKSYIEESIIPRSTKSPDFVVHIKRKDK